ncbi:MAG TPA: alpha/beta fold hydrolase [Pyrinomonadaceae bacterium]|nr:alpha/beta fold hydrolase [Pyrinomonadaceae bacterium]
MSVVKVKDLNIGYTEAGGNTENLPLVFLHGVGSDKSVWDFQLRELSKNRRGVAFDYPGYGESDLPENDLTREKIAAYIFGAMDALQIEKARVCGLSMGGVIALEMFAQNSNRIASLILANTFARHPNSAEIAERSINFVKNNSMREFAEQRVDFLLAPGTSKQIRRQVVETMARIDKKSYRWASIAVWTADYIDLLPKINVPALVIGGDLDQPTPPDLSRELAYDIKGAKMVIIQNAAHLSNLDQPQIFNRLIENFLI